MGRLRGGKEAEYFRRIAAEVTELYGVTDATLYRHYGALESNLATKDPVWDEPSTTAHFQSYDLPCNWFDYEFLTDVSEFGRVEDQNSRAYLAVGHLVAAGVPQNEFLNYVEAGDLLAIHSKCGRETQFYDILQANRVGWVNSSDQFTGYDLELKRRAKYVPERKTQDD